MSVNESWIEDRRPLWGERTIAKNRAQLMRRTEQTPQRTLPQDTNCSDRLINPRNRQQQQNNSFSNNSSISILFLFIFIQRTSHQTKPNHHVPFDNTHSPLFRLGPLGRGRRGPSPRTRRRRGTPGQVSPLGPRTRQGIRFGGRRTHALEGLGGKSRCVSFLREERSSFVRGTAEFGLSTVRATVVDSTPEAMGGCHIRFPLTDYIPCIPYFYDTTQNASKPTTLRKMRPLLWDTMNTRT